MEKPLVTVIVRSYNHEKFIREAIDSVLGQTYENIQLILVDDCSTDSSAQIINEYVAKFPNIIKFLLEKNLGNCKSFNIAFPIAKGKYLIDLAADDVLLPERLERQVELFESLSNDYAMIFSDAVLINEKSEILRNQYSRNKKGELRESIPSGDIYKNILEKYFICTPTMMYKTSVLDELKGFDSDLEYEDFDFWVRAGRKYKFQFQDETLTARRIVSGSQSEQISEKGNNKLHVSTLEVCKKALKLNKTQVENIALSKRLKYEMRQCFFTSNYRVCLGYTQLLKKMNLLTKGDKIIAKLAKRKVDLSTIYNQFKKERQ